MNNEKLIDTLDDQDLLSLIELLSRALMMPEESIRYLADDGELTYELPVEAVDYCEDLSDYQRLKLMQLAINTLVAEAEKPAVESFQTFLPHTC
ncbi:MAG: hypothetical protein KME31_28605 [Tolypothrix carrinoi HA7290-LM1]|jgi:hypothetical protein|nr:hypothetical protein [Tolypothrix carrinoi HA7290-LM1]